MSSAYVVCWIFLQTFQTYFCIPANSVDPDQSDLGPNCLQKLHLKSQADDKADDRKSEVPFSHNAAHILYVSSSLEMTLWGAFNPCHAE